jgi:hypothetical protein
MQSCSWWLWRRAGRPSASYASVSCSAHWTLLHRLPCGCWCSTQTVAGVTFSAECQSHQYELPQFWWRFANLHFPQFYPNGPMSLYLYRTVPLDKLIVTRMVNKFLSVCASEMHVALLNKSLQKLHCHLEREAASWVWLTRRRCVGTQYYPQRMGWPCVSCSYVKVSLAGGTLVNLRRELHWVTACCLLLGPSAY